MTSALRTAWCTQQHCVQCLSCFSIKKRSYLLSKQVLHSRRKEIEHGHAKGRRYFCCLCSGSPVQELLPLHLYSWRSPSSVSAPFKRDCASAVFLQPLMKGCRLPVSCRWGEDLFMLRPVPVHACLQQCRRLKPLGADLSRSHDLLHVCCCIGIAEGY